VRSRSDIDARALGIEDRDSVMLEDLGARGGLMLRNLRPILNRPECYHCHMHGQKLNGVLEVSVSLEETQLHIDSLRKTMIIWAVGITIGLAVMLTLLLSRLVTTPIAELTNTMARAEEGMDVRAKVGSEDELGRLAHSFNSMIIKLNKTKKKVEKLHYEQMKKADRLATVGEMAAGIAHEIKNPLTGIAGVVQVLSNDFGPDDPRKSILKEVLEQIERLDKAVKNLLSFARPPQPKLGDLNVNEIIDKIATFLMPQFSKNGVKLTVNLSPETPVVSGDPELLQQVFLNIMLNGIQSMKDGGYMTVDSELQNVPRSVLTRMGAPDDIQPPAEESEGNRLHEAVSVRISDTGKGIPPDTMLKIFNPFFTTRQQGTGLGLSITQKIVEQHGGGITVESTEGEGTTFIIYLPVSGGRRLPAA
jgi:signal transduction histidine kinase